MVKIPSQLKKMKMKDIQNDQLDRGKPGDRSNQKPAKVGGKTESNSNNQPVKKVHQYMETLDPEEQEEETAIKQGKDEKKESKTGNPTGKKGS